MAFVVAQVFRTELVCTSKDVIVDLERNHALPFQRNQVK